MAESTATCATANIAVVAMLVGEALFFSDLDVLEYAFVVAIGFHLFVILYEEPAAQADIWPRLPLWIPRKRPADHSDQL